MDSMLGRILLWIQGTSREFGIDYHGKSWNFWYSAVKRSCEDPLRSRLIAPLNRHLHPPWLLLLLLLLLLLPLLPLLLTPYYKFPCETSSPSSDGPCSNISESYTTHKPSNPPSSRKKRTHKPNYPPATAASGYTETDPWPEFATPAFRLPGKSSCTGYPCTSSSTPAVLGSIRPCADAGSRWSCGRGG